VLNTIVVVLLTLLFVGIATYLPKLVARAAVRLVQFYAGASDKLSVNNTAIWHVLKAARVYQAVSCESHDGAFLAIKLHYHQPRPATSPRTVPHFTTI
jgi:hypothetical protein